MSDSIKKFLHKKTLENIEWGRLLERLASFSKTPQGKKNFLTWGVEKLPREDAVNLAQCSFELAQVEKKNEIPFSEFLDVETILEKITKSAELVVSDFHQLVRTHKALRSLKSFIERYAREAPALRRLSLTLDSLEEWSDRVFPFFDRFGGISDSASEDLKLLRDYKKHLEIKIKNKISEYLKDQTFKNYLQDSFYTLRDGRLVLPIKSNFKGAVKGIIHDLSHSEQTLFLEPQLIVELNNELKMTQKEIELELKKVLKQLESLTQSHVPVFKKNLEQIVYFDFVQANLALAESWKSEFCCPDFDEETVLSIEGLFHPLLLSEKKLVQNNIDFSKSIVLSGPNTGGKTVLLKSVALVLKMLQSGFLLPAKKLCMHPSEFQLFVELGDDQSLELNTSTFSAHMSQVKDILEQAQNGDYVFIDEIASGTAADEASALAKALCEFFLKKKLHLFVTTHLHALKLFAMNHLSLRVASMDYDPIKKIPLYSLSYDLPGESTAIDVVERLGFSKEFMLLAKKESGENYPELENALTRLSDLKSQYQKDLVLLAEQKKNYELKSQQAEELRQKYFSKMNAQVFSEGKALLKDYRRFSQKIDQLLNENKNITKEKLIESKDELSLLSHELEKKLAASEHSPDPVNHKVKPLWQDLEKGMNLQVLGLGLVVLDSWKKNETQMKKAQLSVKVGSMLTRVSFDKVFYPSQGEVQQMKTQKNRQSQKIQKEIVNALSSNGIFSDENSRCDVRGQTKEEAFYKIEKELNSLSRGAISSLVIIHGHGSEALKKSIRNYLSLERKDFSFRNGSFPGEGGDGATIVSLED